MVCYTMGVPSKEARFPETAQRVSIIVSTQKMNGWRAASHDVLSSDEIESSLEIIESNNGFGEWEADYLTDEEETEVPRWYFPRFPGAENVGTCDNPKHGAEGTVHARVTEGKKTERCAEFAPDPGNMYLSRSGLGPYDSDVETVAGWLAAPRNIVGGVMLLGEPGSGKTALIEAACTHADRRVITHLCTPDDTRESLMLRFVGEGNGEGGTPFVKGPVAKAAEIGAVLYADEFMLLPDGVKPVFYELSDGRAFLSGGQIDGSALPVHPDFRLVVSSNPAVRGASLPEPIGSRFASTTLTVETSAEMLRALNIDEAIVAAWEALAVAGLVQPQVREMRAADYWLEVNPAQAISAFLGEHYPESQREAARNTLTNYIGGGSHMRSDGRLVVS